jgi:hypothetical protein
VKDGFDLVVGRVGGGHKSRSALFGRAAKKIVPGAAGCRLAAIALFGGQAAHVGSADGERNAEPFAQFRNPGLVGIRGRAAKAVIQGGCANLTPTAPTFFQCQKRTQEADTIGAARNSH